MWAVRVPHPFAGEPIITAQIPPPQELTTASTSEAEKTAGENVTEVAQSSQTETDIPSATDTDEAQFASAEEEQAAESNGEKVIVTVEQPVEQDVYRQEAGLVISPRRALTPAPVASILEVSAIGQLPRVGPNGKKPSAVYARPTSLNVIHSDSPKIAIVLGGMGLNAKLTARAVKELPADISMAFAPYGENLQEQVNAARKGGHEVFLQVPLEPVGYPASNPGPRTLLTDAGSGENLDSLYWHMSRFTGYVGVVNYMGGKYLANPEAMQVLLKETRKRGLLFLEDGTLPMSSTQAVAKSTRAEARKANTAIDTDPSAQSILSALQLLEAEAQANGLAIGTGSGLEMTIETLSEWAKGAAERGIIIIPVSAAFKGRMG